MQNNSIYVGLSSLITLERRMDAIAHNVANASTVGFRGEGTKFDTIVSDKASDDVSFATAGKSYIRTEAGPLIKTDNPLDVAVKGDAWMSFSTPQGQVYSRDGRMKMLSTGDLVSVTGNAILDVGGAPRISSDGAIYQNGVQVGVIGLYTIPADADLAYAGTSGVIPSKPAQPVVDDNSVGVVQGMIEGSNVDAMTEMTRLIS
ncbi:flagellar basal body rod protein, partial [Brucella suis bv. 4 str. 40]